MKARVCSIMASTLAAAGVWVGPTQASHTTRCDSGHGGPAGTLAKHTDCDAARPQGLTAEAVVLGSTSHRNGDFGTAVPERMTFGSDLSTVTSGLRWRHWRARAAQASRRSPWTPAESSRACSTSYSAQGSPLPVTFTTKGITCRAGSLVLSQIAFASWQTCEQRSPPLGHPGACSDHRSGRAAGQQWGCSTNIKWGGDFDVYQTTCQHGARRVTANGFYGASG